MNFDLLNREMQIKQFKATEWKQRNIIFNNLLNILQFKFVVEKQYLKKNKTAADVLTRFQNYSLTLTVNTAGKKLTCFLSPLGI